MKHIESFEDFLYTPIRENRRCLNNSKGAFNSDRYYSQILSDQIYVDEIIYTESFIEENQTQDSLPQNLLGGIITFSTDMNSTELSQNKFISFLKQKIVTLVNRITAMKKIDTVAQEFNLQGWTVTKGLHGKYTDRKTGKVFDEKSLSVELVGIPTDVLLDVAEKICDEFKQQSALVKTYEDNHIWFVSGNY